MKTFLLLLGVWLLCLADAVASPPPNDPYVDPATYRSASGVFSLEVEPSDFYGKGKCDCRLLSGGKVVWSKELPFALQEAAVTDDGTVCGFGYREIAPGGLLFGGSEELRIAIFGPRGEVRLDEAFPRGLGPMLWSEPSVSGVMLYAKSGHVAFRVRTGIVKEHWQIYETGTGNRLPKLEPLPPFPPERGYRVQDASPLAETKLTLVTWISHAREGGGTLLGIVDFKGKLLWQISGARLGGAPSILDTSRKGFFEVTLPEEEKRVKFSIAADGDGWTVKQVSSKAFASARKEPAPMAEVKLRALGEFQLGTPPANPVQNMDLDALRGINFISGDGRDQIHVFDKESAALHVFDDQGRRVRIQRIDAKDVPESSPEHLVALPGGKVVIEAPGEMDAIRMTFDAAGKYTGLKPDLGLAPRIGETWFLRRVKPDTLIIGRTTAFFVDDDGKVLRRMDRREDRKWLGYTISAAVAADGTFVVLCFKDSPYDLMLTIFSAEGEPLKTLPAPPLPGAVLRLGMLGMNATHVVMGGSSSVLLVERRNGEVKRLASSIAADPYGVFLMRDGKELWVADPVARKVTRYAMPEADVPPPNK